MTVRRSCLWEMRCFSVALTPSMDPCNMQCSPKVLDRPRNKSIAYHKPQLILNMCALSLAASLSAIIRPMGTDLQAPAAAAGLKRGQAGGVGVLCSCRALHKRHVCRRARDCCAGGDHVLSLHLIPAPDMSQRCYHENPWNVLAFVASWPAATTTGQKYKF